MTSSPHSVRLMPDEIEAIESTARQHGIAFAMDHLGLDGLGNEFLRLKHLEEQLKAAEMALGFIRQWAEHPDQTEAIHQIRDRLESYTASRSQ